MLTYHLNQRKTKIERLEGELGKTREEKEEIEEEIKRLEEGKAIL